MENITNVRRFTQTLDGNLKGLDRIPVIEWAGWWHLTMNRWIEEGLEKDVEYETRVKNFGLDVHHQYWFAHKTPDCPEPARQGAGIIEDAADYDRIKKYLYPDYVGDNLVKDLTKHKAEYESGEKALWYSMEGGFWFPRTLFGIEPHLYSFYDEPELYHRILDDLADYQLSVLEKIYSVCTPQWMTFAEDMSYNKGPMLSKKMFDEFLLPYYKRITPYIQSHGTKVIVDSDGNITEMIPWLQEAGIQGALPLEFQAGVDEAYIKKEFPDFIMIGGFNKMVMKFGEKAMRAEFERLLPVMRQGKFIPSVDHQTPPDVSLENYRIYVSLLTEYAQKAVK